jgi:hypothetical protein
MDVWSAYPRYREFQESFVDLQPDELTGQMQMVKPAQKHRAKR